MSIKCLFISSAKLFLLHVRQLYLTCVCLSLLSRSTLRFKMVLLRVPGSASAAETGHEAQAFAGDLHRELEASDRNQSLERRSGSIAFTKRY